MSVADSSEIALWDEERTRVVQEAISTHAQYWAQQIADMDMPSDYPDAMVAFRELRHCLGALRDFGRP